MTYGIVEREVKLSANSHLSDTEIACTAIRTLEDHLTLLPEQIRVVVDDGWVSLEGTLDWEDQRDIAESVVCCLHGVRGVSNRLWVKGGIALAR